MNLSLILNLYYEMFSSFHSSIKKLRKLIRNNSTFNIEYYFKDWSKCAQQIIQN